MRIKDVSDASNGHNYLGGKWYMRDCCLSGHQDHGQLMLFSDSPIAMRLGAPVQGTDEQQVAGDDFRAIRPTYNHKLNWTAGHSRFELSLSDADSSPCEVLVAAWGQADEQKWKIVPAAVQPAASEQVSVEQQQRMYSIRVRRRDARFGLSLEDSRLALRLVLPASPEQVWKVWESHFVNVVRLP